MATTYVKMKHTNRREKGRRKGFEENEEEEDEEEELSRKRIPEPMALIVIHLTRYCITTPTPSPKPNKMPKMTYYAYMNYILE